MTAEDVRPVGALRPHPLNAAIYRDGPDPAFLTSVRDQGILTPLVVTVDGLIVSGHRRHAAARTLGLDNVPVTIFASDDELDIEAALIESNRQREKTNEQMAREAKRLLEVMEERRKRLQQRNAERLNAERWGTESKGENFPASLPEGRARTLVARRFGVSDRTLEKAIEVVDVIDRLEAGGETARAESLRRTLNGKSTHAGHTEARAAGLVAPAGRAGGEETGPAVTDAQPLLLETHTGEQIPYPRPQSPPTFNQSPGEGISWAKWSWNPVTGCLHGCRYCYAREIATSERTRNAFPVGFTPLFHAERLAAPLNTRLPEAHRDEAQPCEPYGCPWRRVFVCSMADLYGRWVPDAWIEQVHAAMLAAPDWQYILLTKFPARYVGLELPPNAWVGTSVDEQKRVHAAEEAFRQLRGVKVKWLSLEPLLADLRFSDLTMFEWVVIGAQTRTVQPGGVVVEAFAPPFEWVARLSMQAKAAGCKVHLKPNLFGTPDRNDRPGMQPLNEYPTC